MSKEERLVIIFLLCLAVLGVGVTHYKNSNRPEIKIASGDFLLAERSSVVNINIADMNELQNLPGIGRTFGCYFPAICFKLNGLSYHTGAGIGSR